MEVSLECFDDVLDNFFDEDFEIIEVVENDVENFVVEVGNNLEKLIFDDKKNVLNGLLILYFLLKGKVEFRDIIFGYNFLKFLLIVNFNLLINFGLRVVLVGKSGFGKFIIVNLVCGLY